MKSILTRLMALLLAMLCILSGAQAEESILDRLRERSNASAYPEDHIIFQGRNNGTCLEMRGEIELTVVLVSMDGKSWTFSDIAALHGIVDSALATLEAEAADYGAVLDMTPVYYTTSNTGDPDDALWSSNILASIPELKDRTVLDWANRPILFCLNTNGRSYAITTFSRYSKEYVVFYMDRDAGTIRHELLHLYGAEDFYFHDDVEAAAERHFPNSVMLNSDDDAVTDSLTAFLVGWTTVPDATATAFLKDTAHITEEAIEEARAVNQQSGTGAFELDSGMYYGTLEMGCANGLGFHLWENGASYVGDWTWNEFNGKGTLTWADGEYYTGDFINDKRTGKGTLVWNNGLTYTGDFVDGVLTGKGTLSWPDGSSYTGDFVSNHRTGKGTFTWADGRYYTGDFFNDAMTGLGMMYFPNGDMYIGQFADGCLEGIGTMYYADGSVESGEWLQDSYVGD